MSDKKRFHPGSAREEFGIRSRIARFLSRVSEPLGFSVSSYHFYEPIPRRKDYISHANSRRSLPQNIPYLSSRHKVEEICAKYAREYTFNKGAYGFKEDKDNVFFRGLDALFLYSFIREYRPPVVLEFGSGYSSMVSSAALSANSSQGQSARLESVDIYPRIPISQRPDVNDISIQTNVMDIRDYDPQNVSRLPSGSLLFVDSSHVFKVGSDVKSIFEKVLPAVPEGVYVHFHDIFTPYAYPLNWSLDNKRHWNEQYVLETFMSFNSSFSWQFLLHETLRESSKVRDILDHIGSKQIGASAYIKRDFA